MAQDKSPRISKDKDVNDAGQPIYRPEELITKPVKAHWKWIWLVFIILVVLAWLFLFSHFQTHQAPYAAPIR